MPHATRRRVVVGETLERPQQFGPGELPLVDENRRLESGERVCSVDFDERQVVGKPNGGRGRQPKAVVVVLRPRGTSTITTGNASVG